MPKIPRSEASTQTLPKATSLDGDQILTVKMSKSKCIRIQKYEIKKLLKNCEVFPRCDISKPKAFRNC